MSNWNFGSTRIAEDTSASGCGLDLKAFLDQALNLGRLGPTGTGLSSSSSFNTGSSSNSIINNYRGGPIEPPTPSVPFFDPFSPSSFGFFNPKDPGGNLPISVSNNHVGQSKSPNYHSQNHHVSNSPIFGHGGGGSGHNNIGGGVGSGHNNIGGGGGNNGPHSPTSYNCFNNGFNNSTSSPSMNNTPMFPISTFCIEETASNGSDNMSSNGQHHYGNQSMMGRTSSSSSQYNNQQSRGHERDSRSERDSTSNSSNHYNNQTQSEKDNTGIRETGIVEKLLHSYGFLQSCERNARLFFHYSQFEGKIEHLRLGDPVEFEMTYDRRTGKPIASAVTKIGPEVLLGEDRLSGMVTTTTETTGEGRISYENRGECFFLPYAQDDIEGNVCLASGDIVSFQIATNQRTGNLAARFIRLENPTHPIFYRGILSSIYMDMGYIERADVAKQISFTFSETRVNEEIVVGDNVEFNIQTRNGKEVACNITKMPFGTVVFEDIGAETLKGQVLKPIDKTQSSPTTHGPTNNAMQGRLRYRGPNRQELEIVFGEKDQKGCFTLRHGDWVEFQIATDRRDKQQKATNILFDLASFHVSDERREQGIISKIQADSTGFITCAERDQKMFFRYNELLDYNRQPKIGDDVEFTIIPDSNSPCRQAGIRIKYLPAGMVQFEVPLSKGINGVVVREPSTPWVSQEALEGIIPSLAVLGLPQNVTERLIQGLSSTDLMQHFSGTGSDVPGEPGVIQYQMGNTWETVIFHWKDCKILRNIRVGTKVTFDIHQVRRNKEIIAANIRALEEEETTKPVVANCNVAVIPTNVPISSISSDPDTPIPNGSSSSDDCQSPTEEIIELLTNPSNSSASESDKMSNGIHSKGEESPQLNCLNGVDEMTSANGSTKTPRFVMKGFIAALKDGFGFIETMAQDGEIFFHSSSLVGDFGALEVGQEVEYVVSNKGSVNGKNAADMVKPLPKGSIGRAAIFPEVLTGIVVRPVRGANPDQLEYTGLIEGSDSHGYAYGIISMLNKKEILQAGDTVEFQLDAEGKPVNIRAIRKKLRATVEAVKGQYGFLSYELEDGKKLFFHMSEVKDHSHLNPGDEVEFVILQNPRNGKSSACSVVKLVSRESQRPERLLNRLSKMSIDETAPRLIVLRQPHGPDGTRGFHLPRATRKPGFV